MWLSITHAENTTLPFKQAIGKGTWQLELRQPVLYTLHVLSLVSAAEHYREGFEKFSEWYHFQPEYTAFCHAVQTQRALFEGNLEELLITVVRSDSEMSSLLQDPGGPPWLNLEDRLKKRLPRCYDQYRVTMDEINRIMAKFLRTQFGIEQVVSATVRFHQPPNEVCRVYCGQLHHCYMPLHQD